MAEALLKIAIFAGNSEEPFMVIITLQRKKCIGCNYCVELAPGQFRMSKKDGKSVLLHSEEKKGFHTIKSPGRVHLMTMLKRRRKPVL